MVVLVTFKVVFNVNHFPLFKVFFSGYFSSKVVCDDIPAKIHFRGKFIKQKSNKNTPNYSGKTFNSICLCVYNVIFFR